MAERIARAVIREGKPTYALYGGFGAGKSSLLNFVDELLRNDWPRNSIVVRFNAWLPGSPDALAEQLLGDLVGACSSEFYLPSARRIAFNLARAIASGVPHLNGLMEWIPSETQRQAVDRFAAITSRVPRRIVVLIDEVDRMRKEELFVLLKVLRGFSFIPHLTFVCALERKHVESLIRDEWGDVAPAFYHKFFVESFEIPKLLDSFLESETHEALLAALDDAGWFPEGRERSEFSDKIHQFWEAVFAKVCTNYRELKRLASAVHTTASALAGEVNAFDLTLLTALRLVAPEAVNLIWEFRDLLCAGDVNSQIANPEKAYSDRAASFLKREGEITRDYWQLSQIAAVRQALFPNLESVIDLSDSRKWTERASRFFQENSTAAVSRRLRNASYFPAYFQDVLPAGIFPERRLAELLKALKTSSEVEVRHLVGEELVGLQDSPERRANFLGKLSQIAMELLGTERCAWVANSLLGYSLALSDPNSIEEYRHLARFVLVIADELFLRGRTEARAEFLRQSILGARADGVAVLVFRWAVVGRPIPENFLAVQRGISPVQPEELEGAFLYRMEQAYGPSVSLDGVNFDFAYWEAFLEWGRLLAKSPWARNREVQHEFWRRYLSSQERVAKFARLILEPFYFARNSGDPSVSLDDEILPLQELRRRIQEQPPYQDPLAIAYIREVLGKDLIPEPLKSSRDRSASLQPPSVL